MVWLERLPATPLNGVIVGNEVADALPVQRFVVDGDTTTELGVSRDGDTLVASPRAADRQLRDFVAGLALDVQQPYCSEVNLALPAWLVSLSDALGSGAIVLLDYGYSRAQYYHRERSAGTLRCYYRHRAHDDPFFWPGLQDITAWVDFSALAEAGAAAGLSVAGYTTQANFLLAAGIEARLAVSAAADEPSPDLQLQAELAAGLRTLMLPGEMGEAVKVMALTRGLAAAPSALLGRDMRAAL